MAIVKIYRAAYVYNGGSVKYSGWVQEGEMQSVIEYLATINSGDDGPYNTPPEIIGWEEKSLDTEPV